MWSSEEIRQELARVQAILNPGSQPADPNREASALAEEIRREREEMKRERDLARCEQTLTAKLAERVLLPSMVTVTGLAVPVAAPLQPVN